MSLSTSDKLTLIGLAIAFIGLIVAIVTLLVTVVIPLVQHSYSEKKNLKAYYLLVWERAARLKRDKRLRQKLLGTTRPFPRFYLREGQARTIAQWLSEGKNVAIAGQPLSGKTRLVFEAIGDQPWDLLMPNWVNINPESFVLPKRRGLAFWRRRVVILDDLHRLVEMQGFNHFLRLLSEPDLTVVATCRSNQDEAKIKHYFTAQNLDYEAFFPRRLLLEKIEWEVAQDIAQRESEDWTKVKFNGTVGSIFMKLGEMERRFEQCEADLKTILRVLRQLYRCGIYQENQVFPRRWVKRWAQEKGLTGTDYGWTEWFNQLAAQEFLTVRPDGEAVEAEEVYLESVVLPELVRERLAEMAEGLAVFAEEADALYRLGRRAYKVGLNDLDKARYQRLAIKAVEGALLFYRSEQFSIERGNSLNVLGLAYWSLGEVEDKAVNCKAAIAAYEEALTIFTRDRPMDYAMTQSNLGVAYRSLGEVEDKAVNCKAAIAAHQEALIIRTRDRFPMDYAMTQNNLGIAHRNLGDIEDKAVNCKAAIAAYQEALTIFTRDRPMDYAMTKINLGAAYQVLGEVEDKAENCKAAIAAYEEAQTIFTRDSFLLKYATIQNNLGAVYGSLGEVENKVVNCKKSIAFCKETLTIFTRDSFRMNYATTQKNLGLTYRTLGQVEDMAVNCKKAIAAYKEALTIFTRDSFPLQYAEVQLNLGSAYATLAAMEDKRDNSQQVRQAYEEALKFFTEAKLYKACQIVINNMKKLDFFLSQN